MSKYSSLITALAILTYFLQGSATAQPAPSSTEMKPPIAKKVPKVLKIHGYEITDNYAWLRDRNDQKNPEIIKYLEENNAYTDSFMKPHQPFVDTLYKEMMGRIKQTDLSVPYRL